MNHDAIIMQSCNIHATCNFVQLFWIVLHFLIYVQLTSVFSSIKCITWTKKLTKVSNTNLSKMREQQKQGIENSFNETGTFKPNFVGSVFRYTPLAETLRCDSCLIKRGLRLEVAEDIISKVSANWYPYWKTMINVNWRNRNVLFYEDCLHLS